MAQDPWAWANQQQAAPLSNTIQAQKQPEMAPGQRPPQGPLGMAETMLVARGVNAGVDKAVDPKAWQSLGNTLNPGASSLADAANAGPNADAMSNLMTNTGSFGTAPLGVESGAAIGGAEAATAAAIPAAAETAAASVGAPAAAAAGAGAAEAGGLAAMGGPIGMGVAGLLLAKKFGYI